MIKCKHCGADAEPLLMSSGALARRVDTFVVDYESGCDTAILFKDLRNEPMIDCHPFEMPLGAVMTPLLVALMLKATPGVLEMALGISSSPNSHMGELSELGVIGKSGSGEQGITFMVSEVLPWACGVMSVLMLILSMWRVWDARRKIEDEAIGIQLNSQISALRRRAEHIIGCGWCNQMSAPGHEQLDIQEDMVRLLVKGREAPNISPCETVERQS